MALLIIYFLLYLVTITLAFFERPFLAYAYTVHDPSLTPVIYSSSTISTRSGEIRKSERSLATLRQ